MFYKVDKDKCIKCSICEKICVSNIIKMEDDGYPHVEAKKEKRCLKCGHCMAFCPTDACSVAALDRNKFTEITLENIPSVKQAEAFLLTRRSIRNFKKEELSTEILTEIITLASTAPTAKNSQNVSWVIITNRNMMVSLADEMARIYEQDAAIENNAATKAILTSMANAHKKGKDIFMRNAVAMAISLVPQQYEWKEDGVIASSYLELAAHAKKLGTCWAGFFIRCARNNQSLRELAKIPENSYICGAHLLGKPLFTPIKRAPQRKENEIIWN